MAAQAPKSSLPIEVLGDGIVRYPLDAEAAIYRWEASTGYRARLVEGSSS
jgi:hypothetical protein